MANALYTTYKNRVEGSGSSSLADWDTDTIKGSLCSAAYTPSLASDAFFSDLTGVVASATLSSMSIVSGAVKTGSTLTFTSVTGSVCTQLVLWKDTGSGATSPLLAYFDTFSSGMPVTPDSTNIVLTFNASGIWTL